MPTYIVSDHVPTTARVRETLHRAGWDCPAAHVLALDPAAHYLANSRPEVVVVVLRPDTERALGVVRQLHGLASGLLVLGPAESKLILQALRDGADLYLDEAELESELLVSFTRLQNGASSQAKPGRFIGVLAASGGSGSSTLAVNIAAVLAREHKMCALLDLKLEAGDLAALLDLRPVHTLADLCQHAARMDRSMLERSLVCHGSGIHLLAGTQNFRDLEAIKPEGVQQALTLARAAFPYVVADLDHAFRAEQAQVLRQADVVLLVLRLEIPALLNVRRVLDHLERLGIGKDRIRLVANRYGQPKELPATRVEKALETKIFHYVPDDPKTINRATNSGVPAVLDTPSAPISRSLQQLAHGVNGQHNRY